MRAAPEMLIQTEQPKSQPGVKRKRVPVHGVLLLDKAPGVSSNGALIAVKRLFNAEKAGHTGTLDPFATGLLPLCFGEATKFAQDLLEADKTYEATLHLGTITTTGDTEGELVSSLPVETDATQIEQILQRFRGPIAQVPPMHSALKRDGKPLYDYARAGITLERVARNVTIHSLVLLDYAAPLLRIRVTCSKGTYVRVLGEDIGAALGCGAHLSALRRTAVASLSLEQAVNLESLGDTAEALRRQFLLPVDALLSSFPLIELDAELTRRFLHGQRLAMGAENIMLPASPGRVRVYGVNRQLLGTGQLLEHSVLAPERLISAA